MPSRKSRLAIAYTSSIVLNGAFWLFYSHTLRSSNSRPAAASEAVERMKPMTVGLFKPLPPVPPRQPVEPPPGAGQRQSETGDTDRSQALRQAMDARDAASRVLAQKQAAASAAQARAAETAAQAQESRRAALAEAANVQAAHAFVQQAQAKLNESRNALAAARAALDQAKPQDRQSQAGAVQAAVERLAQDTAQAQSAHEVLAHAETAAEAKRRTAETREAAAQAAQNKATSLEAEAVKAQNRLTIKVAAVQSLLQQSDVKVAALSNRDSDTESRASNDETESPQRASDEPQKPEKPQSNIVLQRIQMWSPRPGQKFNLATNLNITFPKDMQVTPGPPLTEDQLAQIQELMRHQHLHQVKMDKRQVKKLADMRRKTTSKPKPAGTPDSDDERRRMANKPKPRPIIHKNVLPEGPTANLPRPRSPFVMKAWDSDMYSRWSPRQRDDANVSGTQGVADKAPGAQGGGDKTPGDVQVASNTLPDQNAPNEGETPDQAAPNTQGETHDETVQSGDTQSGQKNAPNTTQQDGRGANGAGQGAGDGKSAGDAGQEAGGNKSAGDGQGAGDGKNTGDGKGADATGGKGTDDGSGKGTGDGNGKSAGDGNGKGTGDGSGKGTGEGNGKGAGDGSGNGKGTGDGSGKGSGDGSGKGTGEGNGSGKGTGEGNGTGNGSGNGKGAGDGNGDGQGTGDGSGQGTGDGSGQGQGDGAGALSAEGSDGMDGNDDGMGEQGLDENVPADASQVGEVADLPPDPPIAGHTVPGALVLPPAPPVGVDNGKNPTPRKVEHAVKSPPGDRTAQVIRRTAQPAMSPMRSAQPQKMTKEPVGQPDRTGRKPIPPALTIGSVSAAGQIPMTVMARPHLPIGTPADAIDPLQPPAKGTPKSLSLQPEHRATPPEKLASATQPTPPNKALPVKEMDPRPAVVRLARNSQGIRNGALQPLPATPMPDDNTLVGDGSGLKGEYYEGKRFDTYEFTRADPNVAYDWLKRPTQSPGGKVRAFTDYTVRWTGRIVAPYTETYTFYAAVDDGVRVWINHKLVLDHWSANSMTQFSNKFTFRAGEQYLFKCEYLEVDGGDALVFLYWSSPHTPKQYIPEDAFFYPLPDDEAELKLDTAPY